MLLLVFFFVTIVTVVVARTPEVHLSPAQLAELFPRIPQDSAAGNGHLHSGHLVQGSAGSGDLVGSGSGDLVRTLLLFPLHNNSISRFTMDPFPSWRGWPCTSRCETGQVPQPTSTRSEGGNLTSVRLGVGFHNGILRCCLEEGTGGEALPRYVG